MHLEKKHLIVFLLPFPTLIIGFYLFSDLYTQVKKAEKLILKHESRQGRVSSTRKKTSFVGQYGRRMTEHFVHYEFLDKNGKKRRSPAFYDVGKNSFVKDQKIEIFVDPSDDSIHMPKFRAIDLSEKKENYGLWILLIVWASFAPSCILLLIGFLRSR